MRLRNGFQVLVQVWGRHRGTAKPRLIVLGCHLLNMLQHTHILVAALCNPVYELRRRAGGRLFHHMLEQ